jgi:hypothetical protein
MKAPALPHVVGTRTYARLRSYRTSSPDQSCLYVCKVAGKGSVTELPPGVTRAHFPPGSTGTGTEPWRPTHADMGSGVAEKFQ